MGVAGGVGGRVGVGVGGCEGSSLVITHPVCALY